MEEIIRHSDEKLEKQLGDVYELLVPSAWNHPAFDAVLLRVFRSDDGQICRHVYTLQMTKAARHSLSVAPLSKIAAGLKATALAHVGVVPATLGISGFRFKQSLGLAISVDKRKSIHVRTFAVALDFDGTACFRSATS